MCDPCWIYGLSIELKSMYEYALEKAPECVRGKDKSKTSIAVVEKFGRQFKLILSTEVGYDVFDEELKPHLILVLHEEDFGFSNLRLEDEEFLRKELGIEEKGKWYRYVGAFNINLLEKYKKVALRLGSIPSRAESSKEGSKICTACGGSGRLPA